MPRDDYANLGEIELASAQSTQRLQHAAQTVSVSRMVLKGATKSREEGSNLLDILLVLDTNTNGHDTNWGTLHVCFVLLIKEGSDARALLLSIATMIGYVCKIFYGSSMRRACKCPKSLVSSQVCFAF